MLFRFGILGVLIGVAIGFPIAFLLAFFRLYDQHIIVAGVFVRHTIWLPIVMAVAGLIGGLIVGALRKKGQS